MHTPGPWVKSGIWGPAGVRVACAAVSGYNRHVAGVEEAKIEDINLMCAAPEMYSLLEEAREISKSDDVLGRAAKVWDLLRRIDEFVTELEKRA